MVNIIRTRDYEELSRRAAAIIAAQVTLNPASKLGLATGSSPEGLYRCLVASYEAGDLDFSQVTTYNLDEYRGISHDNDQSYYYFMRKNLFDHVNVPEDAIHMPDGENPDADAECVAYEAAIRAIGGVDLQLLGIGHNGHIGFNEPSDAFDTVTHCVDLAESTIQANSRFFASADEVPRQAYTMGIGTIMCAKKVLLVVSGEGKAQAVKDSFFGPVTPQVPASILQFHPDVTVVADEAALSLC